MSLTHEEVVDTLSSGRTNLAWSLTDSARGEKQQEQKTCLTALAHTQTHVGHATTGHCVPAIVLVSDQTFPLPQTECQCKMPLTSQGHTRLATN